ncbi:MAG: hypothetical protein A2X36_01590 [Elusimicrobia bacterium GWA2_69_24]|nr:MAG: hypothetical protein A2X36_01590 [Elusimicrobia bacterium GWA2_69_24]HBL19146.1 alpha/beta hydrolase [Elusimicrobiota bacterium]
MSTASKLVFIAIALGLLFGGLRWFERINIYFPSRELSLHPGSLGIPYEDVLFQSEDGLLLHGWFLDAAQPMPDKPLPFRPPLPAAEPLQSKSGRPPVLVLFHGNAGNVSNRIEKLAIFRKLGLSAFVFDYRGYGRSQGSPSEQGTYRDGLAAVDLLTRDMGYAPQELVYYGESLGCAVALETALRRPPQALVLDSGFTSTVEMGRRTFPFLPVRWMVRFRYDNLSKIGGLKVPLLVLHSPQDDIVPFDMGQANFAAAPRPKIFVETRGDHNEGFADTPYWAQAIRDFLAELF